MQSALRVISERHCGDAVSQEARYFISSLPPEQVVRAHWQIENALHWSLDIAFNEDQQRMRSGDAAANMALLNKIALNLLKRSPTKTGLKTRRKRTGWDEKYLLRVLTAGLGI